MKQLIQVMLTLIFSLGVLGYQRSVAETPTPLQDENLDLDTLKRWGERKFSFNIERNGMRERLGTVAMNTQFKDQTVTLHDVWKLKWRGNDLSLDLKMNCHANNLLRPTKIASVGKGDDEVGSFTVSVNETSGVVEAEDGRVRRIDFPPDTLTDAALFRILTLLPRDEEKTYSIGHFMEISELNLKGPATIQYKGLDEIKLHGDLMSLHKFNYERDGRVSVEVWLDDKDNLRQIRIDDRKLLIEEGN